MHPITIALAVLLVAMLTASTVRARHAYALLAAALGLTDSMILGLAGKSGDGNL